MKPLPPGFVPADDHGPLDLDYRIAHVPAHAVVKGMFIRRLVDDAAKHGHTLAVKERLIAFKDYPVPVYLNALVEAARVLHPSEPPRRALRLLGHGVYPQLVDSMIGKVVFGVLGRDIHSILRVASKAYEIASNLG